MVTAALLLSVSGSGDARADGPAGDKPLAEGGMNLSRAAATMSLLGFIALCMVLFRQRPASARH